MNADVKLTGRLIRAARALAGVSRPDFAQAAGMSDAGLGDIEAGGSTRVPPSPVFDGLKRALEHYGVVIVDETDGLGAGVRLKFTRQDVRQIGRLEDEGGLIGSDDAP